MDLNTALAAHAAWKSKFRTAITKEETMDAMTIAKDNCCELGKWLHGEAKAQYGTLATYNDCVAKHAAFHVEAGKVAQTINAKKYSAAEAMIDADTPYLTASGAVATAIVKFKNEVNI